MVKLCCVRLGIVLLTVALGAAVLAEEQQVAPASPGTREFELQKWDHPQDYLVQKGPGGTEWDGQYRSFIQTDESATSKGYPTHAKAAEQIKADSAASPEKLQMHKSYILFIKHFSQAYRPESATADLKKLYEELVAMEFGEKPQVTARASLPFEGDPRLNIYRDVVYGKDAPEFQKLDAYILKSEHPTPVIIEIHGGGWRRGVKSQFFETYSGDLVRRLLDAGISVVSIDYRLTPKYQLPAQMQDVVRALQFVRSKAKEWNVDAGHIAAMGGSAGAHLSAWVALHDEMANPNSADPVERESSRLSAFIEFSGPMDLTRVKPTVLAKEPMRGEDFANAFTAAFGTTYEGFEKDPAVQARVKEASPIFLVTPDDPPAFIVAAGGPEVSGKDHAPVPEMINNPHSAWHGVLLADRMEEAGIEVVRYLGPEVGQDRAKDSEAIVAFLAKHLIRH